VKSIVRDRITLFVAVPTVYNILSKKNFSSFAKLLMRILVKVRLCFSGASALPETTLREFEKRFSIPLIEGYGLTEASPVISVNPLNGPRKPASVGLPIPGVEISVTGEDGAALPQGEIGELIVKGPNVMQGYYNRLKETSDVLRNGWLYTGDLVKIDEDGYIFIMDRKKDLIIVDGMNIYPREIEDHVSSHPSVDECAMVGVPDEKGSELTCLYIKKYENADVSEKEIHNFLQDKIARFKAPKRIRFIEEFPKTATGKIKKSELKKWRL
jgi:long-chain acyl-CoA synthetase